MPVKALSNVIAENAASAIRERGIRRYADKVIAIDATMTQNLIVGRQRALIKGKEASSQGGDTEKKNDGKEEPISHLPAMFFKTVRMMESGIKPVYVFDGQSPKLLKTGVAASTPAAKQQPDTKNLSEYELRRRNEKWTAKLRESNEETKQLLDALGVPYIDAPAEAEAQCAAMVNAGRVYATGTEDMDALTFGSNVLVRNLNFGPSYKQTITEYHLEDVLEDLGNLTRQQFVDLCILLGCDYCGSIANVGPKRALSLIKKHGSIEEILKNINTKIYEPPKDWNFEEARKMFFQPSVDLTDEKTQFTWKPPSIKEIKEFLITDKGFDEEHINRGIFRLNRMRNNDKQGGGGGKFGNKFGGKKFGNKFGGGGSGGDWKNKFRNKYYGGGQGQGQEGGGGEGDGGNNGGGGGGYGGRRSSSSGGIIWGGDAAFHFSNDMRS